MIPFKPAQDPIPDTPKSPASGDHIAGIDGLRAIAALAVFFLHTEHGYAKGGGIGVDIFFVISGLVITKSLLREYEIRGGINIPAFYLRRIIRLWPALLVLALVIWLIYPTEQTLTKEVLPSVFYYTNWALQFGYGPLILGHTWTLANEEQFYLIWPFVLLLCLHFLSRRNAIAVIFMLALAPVVWKAILVLQGYPFSNLYLRIMGGRTEGLFLGAALAFVQPAQIKQIARLFWPGALFLALCLHFSHPSQTWFWLGGSFLVQLSTVTVLAKIISYPGSRTVKWLEWPPLRSLGQISYGFYLWHFPIIEVLLVHTPVRTWGSFVLSVICAILSWHLVERPAKRLLPRWAGTPSTRSPRMTEDNLQLSLSPPSTGA